MATDARIRRPEDGGSRRDRLVPSRRLTFDVLAVTTWVLAVAAALHDLAVPTWLYYAIVAGGVVGYLLVAVRAEAWAKRTRER
jgi:hypothetical protein